MKKLTKRHARILIASVFFLMSATTAWCQQEISGFLLSAEEDPKVRSINEQISYLDEKPYRLAPVQSLQFRTASNQLDPTRQEYGMRLNPANPWEVRNNNQYFRQYQSMLSLKKGLALKEALYARYKLAADLLYHRELQVVREKESELINTYISIMEEQQYSDFFDGEDYVKLKLDQIDRDVEHEEAAFERDDVVRHIASMYSASSDPSQWKADHIITMSHMMAVVDSLFSAQLKPATLSYFDERINLVKREYALERSNISVGFLQATYERFRIDAGRRPWSLSMGVTIPIFNPNKGDMAKRKIELIEEQQDKSEAQAEMSTFSMRYREQLRNLIKRYNGIEEKIKSLSVDHLSKTLNTMKGSNPAVQIRLNANILKLQVLRVKIRQSACYAYIEFLAQVDALQQTPMINYLSDSLEMMGR